MLNNNQSDSLVTNINNSLPPSVKPINIKPIKTKKIPKGMERIYVLDTNVLLHDPTSLYQFKEHDIYLPMIVLEELDKHKKGDSDIARNARSVSRELDNILQTGSLKEGFELYGPSEGRATGRIFFKSPELQKISQELEAGKADNLILRVALELAQNHENVSLVSNDINLRIKALAHEVKAQSYRSDRVLLDEDVLPSGITYITEDYWENHQQNIDNPFWRKSSLQWAATEEQFPVNSFLIETTSKNKSRLWRVHSSDENGSQLYQVTKNVTMISPKNNEQELALNLLHDPDIDFIGLLGAAGTGKTLLALASGLQQVNLDVFDEVLLTKATVNMGEDIGFLPGTQTEKMGAWLGGVVKDAFSVLGIKEDSPLAQKIEIASMSFMRGRSFHKKFIIIDEAQNLTISQMRAMLTRVSRGSKIVLTGNLSQIDTPYLDAGNSGLSWAIKQMQGWKHAGHLILPNGVRSRLASYIEQKCENQK